MNRINRKGRFRKRSLEAELADAVNVPATRTGRKLGCWFVPLAHDSNKFLAISRSWINKMFENLADEPGCIGWGDAEVAFYDDTGFHSTLKLRIERRPKGDELAWYHLKKDYQALMRRKPTPR